MLQALFHAWERRLAHATTNRVPRPFEWGLDWIGAPHGDAAPAGALRDWVRGAMADTDAFFSAPPTGEYVLGPPSPDKDRLLTFPSAEATPHVENNTVVCRYFPARGRRDRGRAAVLVLPQWNADEHGHVGLSR